MGVSDWISPDSLGRKQYISQRAITLEKVARREKGLWTKKLFAKGQTVDEHNSSRRKDKKRLKIFLYKAKEKANSQTNERAEIKKICGITIRQFYSAFLDRLKFLDLK